MKYDLKQLHEIKRFYRRAKAMVKSGALVDFTNKSKRSTNQNNYIHLLFSAFALEYGCTEMTAKQKYFKKKCCPDVFVYYRTNKMKGQEEELRSTADIPLEQMTECISRFKEWSAMEAGIDLPNATDQGWLASIELEASKMQHYLK